MGHFKMKLFSAATAVIIVCIQYCNGKHFLVQTKDTDYDEDPSAADYSYARPSTTAPRSKYGDYSYARPSTSAPSSYARPSTAAPRSKYGSDYGSAPISLYKSSRRRKSYGNNDYSSYSRPSYSRSGGSARRSYAGPVSGGSTLSPRGSSYGRSTRSSRRSNYGASRRPVYK